jgi:Protein of unknown function (DUF3179)
MSTFRRFLLLILVLGAPISLVNAQLKNPKNIEFQWSTDTTQTDIPLEEFYVVLPRNSFPVLNYPQFVGKEEGLRDFFYHEPVISVSINGEAKAYPLNMLTMHEMSNDSCGGVPILPTFCPLCNSAVVFDRRIRHDDKDYVLEFEVSGMLRHSDMVMVDKETESWWQQLMGEGLVGEFAGEELDIVSSMILSVEEFFNHYPHGKILNHHTGMSVESMYGHNPYVHYDSAGHKPYEKYFDHKNLNLRLEPMERVVAVKGDEGYRIYPFSEIANKGVINDDYEGKKIVILYEKGTVSVLDEEDISKSKEIGSATVFFSRVDGQYLTFKNVDRKLYDIETGSEWDIAGTCIEGPLKGKELIPQIHSNHFAFAWLNFNPDSEIYGSEDLKSTDNK